MMAVMLDGIPGLAKQENSNYSICTYPSLSDISQAGIFIQNHQVMEQLGPCNLALHDTTVRSEGRLSWLPHTCLMTG